MGFYDDNVIEEIKSKADIVNIISEFLPLKKRGRNFIANCPFHNEKTPSFTVSPEKQIYHCFGCNASGNVFSFLMQHENMTFPEALKYLGDRFGIEVKGAGGAYPAKTDDKAEERKNRLHSIHLFVSRYFYKKLRDSYGKEALAYAKKRGLSQETLESFHIGYAPYKSDDLLEQLDKLGYEEDELIDSGIFSKSAEGRIYSKFFNRLIFPIETVQGKIIGFGGRVLGSGEPKYLNSPESPIFHKKYNLYALNLAKEEIRRKNQILLMEGYMDVIAVWQKGVRNAVASLGTAFTVEQGRLMLRYANEIVIVYDSDDAGKKAAIRAMEVLRPLKAMVRIAEFAGAKDPDEYINLYGLAAFEERIRNAKTAFRYLLDLGKSTMDYAKPEEKVRCIRLVLPEVMAAEDPLLRNEYLKILSKELDVEKEDLEAIAFGKEKQSPSSETGQTRGKTHEIDVKKPEDKAELYILRILVHQLEYADLIQRSFLEYIHNPLIHEALRLILDQEERPRSLDALAFKQEESKPKSLIAYLALQDPPPAMNREEFDQSLRKLVRMHLRNEIESVIKKINAAEKEGNKPLSVELQNEWNRLKTEINNI